MELAKTAKKKKTKPDEFGIKYPLIVAQLSGEDGNIYGIIGRVVKAMRRGGIDEDEITKFKEEVMSSDSYEHAIGVCTLWVTCD